MTGAEIALLVSALMSGAGALFGGGGNGQERESFRNAPELLQNAVGQTSGAMEAMKGLLGQEINLTQAPAEGSLPTFAGGGMPLPLGILGGAGMGETAAGAPKPVGLRGINLAQAPFDGLRRDARRPTPNAVPTGRRAVPRPPGQVPGTATPRASGIMTPDQLMAMVRERGMR